MQIPDYMHETGLRLPLVAGRNKTEIPLHDGELYENKCVGWNFTIETTFLLSRQCLVTTKKAAVALEMILNCLNCLDFLFALKKTTFHLKSVIFKHRHGHITQAPGGLQHWTSVMGNWGHLLLELVMQKFSKSLER